MPVRYSSDHDDPRRARPEMGSNIKRRYDSSLSRSALILSSVVVGFLASAVLAVGVAMLFAWKRRQERAVSEFSARVWELARETGPAARLGLAEGPKTLGQLGSAVNQLLENLEQRGARLLDREQLFQRLVETVHDAVLVHRERILFANSRFLALLNMSAPEVIGRPLTDFVAAEYVELVQNNLRRRLQGEAAAARYEVELVGAQAQVTRVELSSTVIDSAGEAALLLTAVEMLPDTAPVRFQLAAFFDRVLPPGVTPLLDAAFENSPGHAHSLRALITAQCGNSIEELPAVPQRRDAKLLQVISPQVRQDRLVDVVLAEHSLVLSEAQAPQPNHDVHDGA